MKPTVMLLSACISSALCTSANAGETARRAVLVDFRDPALPRSDIPQISRVMRRDFSRMLPVSEPRPDFVLQPRARFVSSSLTAEQIRIPKWMYQRSSTGFVDAESGHIVSLGGCVTRPYRPSNILGLGAERRRKALYPLVHHAACNAGIPVALMDALLMQESRYNPIATSRKGAFGLGQLMPATARHLGVDRYSIHGNLRGTARYLSWQLRAFGRVDLALAAYNAGPGRVRAARGMPRIAETRDYVRIVLANWSAIESNHASPQHGLAYQTPGRSIWHGDFRKALASLPTN